jgi:choline dehydrogenase-like flavoprotein
MDPVNETRSYAKIGHYDQVRSRKNYDLLTEYKVAKINFSPLLCAKGVTILPRYGNGKAIQVGAKKEVVLAAGALHTPQLLQLSGIGPEGVLENAGINVLLDLPSVGQNLQDHAFLTLGYNCELCYEVAMQFTTGQ